MCVCVCHRLSRHQAAITKDPQYYDRCVEYMSMVQQAMQAYRGTFQGSCQKILYTILRIFNAVKKLPRSGSDILGSQE